VIPQSSLVGMEQTRCVLIWLVQLCDKPLTCVVKKTADLWTSKGSVVKPTNDDGSVAGKSGLDAELGPGLYLSDTLSVYVQDADP